MNRLAPLIVRQPRAFAFAHAAPREQNAAAPAPAASEEMKLFATSFLGGLAFFGTYLA